MFSLWVMLKVNTHLTNSDRHNVKLYIGHIFEHNFTKDEIMPSTGHVYIVFQTPSQRGLFASICDILRKYSKIIRIKREIQANYIICMASSEVLSE